MPEREGQGRHFISLVSVIVDWHECASKGIKKIPVWSKDGRDGLKIASYSFGPLVEAFYEQVAVTMRAMSLVH